MESKVNFAFWYVKQQLVGSSGPLKTQLSQIGGFYHERNPLTLTLVLTLTPTSTKILTHQSVGSKVNLAQDMLDNFQFCWNRLKKKTFINPTVGKFAI